MSNPIGDMADLNKVVHEPRRFAIRNALWYGGGVQDYVFLQRVTGLTQGNLASHLRKLEEVGLVELEKIFLYRRPKTRVVITEAGKTAVENGWRHLESIKQELENGRALERGDEGSKTE